MENCPRCQSRDIRKDGIVKEKQRYYCKNCKYHFTVEHRGKGDDVKRNALILYLEGLGFRSIGRFLDVSHVAVYNWVKGYGEKLEELRSDDKIEVVEMDEMNTYIMSKKTTVGFGSLLIEMGKSSSIAWLAPGGRQLGRNSGRPSRKK